MPDRKPLKLPRRQNSAKPERGIETIDNKEATMPLKKVRTALSPNAGLKRCMSWAMRSAQACQNSAKPERGIETGLVNRSTL